MSWKSALKFAGMVLGVYALVVVAQQFLPIPAAVRPYLPK